jgi:ribose transport system ATP-binding protein
VADTSEKELIRMMVGREVSTEHFDAERERGEELLCAEGVTNESLKGCSFSVHAGEIVGMYGLVGAGRTELTRALFGADGLEEGSVRIRGAATVLRSPRQGIDRGLSLVPEDRRRQGLALELSVRDNLNLAVYRRHARLGAISSSRERAVAERFIQDLAIRTPEMRTRVRNLSGGNQQKVVLGKWLATGARVFLMDEPTNGIDIGAKEEIYRLVNRLAREGAAILFVSSYMPELMGICDRILVMNRGRLVADVPRGTFCEESILRLALESGETVGDPHG